MLAAYCSATIRWSCEQSACLVSRCNFPGVAYEGPAFRAGGAQPVGCLYTLAPGRCTCGGRGRGWRGVFNQTELGVVLRLP